MQVFCFGSEILVVALLLQDDDDYSLIVNLKRMYHLQSAVNVFNDGLFGDMLNLLEEFSNLDDEVCALAQGVQ